MKSDKYNQDDVVLASPSIQDQTLTKIPIYDYKTSGWKWIILLLASILLMANYFCYDNLSPIQNTLEKDLGIT